MKNAKMASKSSVFVPSPPLVGVELNPGPRRKKHLSNKQRIRAVTLSQDAGWSENKIAKHMKVTQPNISNLLTKYKKSTDMGVNGKQRSKIEKL